MSSKILVLCYVISVLVALVHSRGNINVGNKHGGHLIYHEVHEKYGIPFIRRYELVTVEGIRNELIHGIVVQDLEGGGVSYIKNGGLGKKNVTIKLESGTRGDGYKFLVDVYAT